MSDVVIDSRMIESMVLQAVQDNILASVQNLAQDPVWLARIERMINQTVTHETIARIGSMDINTIIHERVDQNIKNTLIGIDDQATQIQLTVMDDTTVVENTLTAKDIDVPGSATITNLVVKGSINTDNQAWQDLANNILAKVMNQISKEWREQLIDHTVKQIQTDGIDFKQVTVEGQSLINGNTLASVITQTSIQSTGTLDQLTVAGETHLNDTVSVIKNRLGINTRNPDMALTIWDEEVAVVAGKFKDKQAYIGTSRLHGLAIGINRQACIDIDINGLTTVKQLQVGVHKISHAAIVPGWSGTKGDLVFNSNPGADRVFAWVCLGAHKWQPLKSAE
jgi:hypothetical protein